LAGKGTRGSPINGASNPDDKVSYAEPPQDESQWIYLPKFEVQLLLGREIMSSERASYTFFTVLGDVGGFNGAIVILPSFLMSFYSQQMYNKSVAAETPIRRPARRNNKHKKQYKVPEQVLGGL